MADRGSIIATETRAGAFSLSSRSPTLGGNVPLRAARSCPPFLLGNAFGLVLSPPDPIVVRRGFRSVEVSPRPLRAECLSSHEVAIELDTGLALASEPAAFLVVERAYNRRDRRVSVLAQPIAAGLPVTLSLRVRIARGESLSIAGEIATIGAYLPDPALVQVSLRDAQDIARAHVAFFDERYFSGKRGAPTGKYKKAAGTSPEATRRPAPGCAIVHAGGAPAQLVRGSDGVLAVTSTADVGAKVGYHGQRVHVELDPAAKARRAASIERAFDETFGEDHEPGALLYFTTYATPHSAGDPHVFFKPALLIAAPPELALVIDGPEAPGLEGLRGVTEPAWFHALPAVSEVVLPEARLEVGATLFRARFAPRAFVAPRLIRA